MSDILSDDRPQPSQPQETSKDDLNNILAEYDAKKKRDSKETDQNNEDEDAE